ncbi:MAG: hypothetical protein QOE55_445, partial [Acidobacteriaceae bacterium]|nr:hypothetical protein [Acidobacteriaceae bacterium]
LAGCAPGYAYTHEPRAPLSESGSDRDVIEEMQGYAVRAPPTHPNS